MSALCLLQILRNKIGPGVTAECIDIKENSGPGLIQGNTFDGSGELAGAAVQMCVFVLFVCVCEC